MQEDHSPPEQCDQPLLHHFKKKGSSFKKDRLLLFKQDELIDLGLEGFVKSNKGLVLLKGYRTILRRDFQNLNQVRLLAGGRTGFEPLYSGFVGPGMLTAVCLGDKQSIPSYQMILVALRELSLNSKKGIIVVLENSMEGKLNFGLAVECAIKEGIRAKVVLVDDNCSDFSASKSNRKGLVGVVFLYKVAAAMAESGKCLEEIHDFCVYLSNSSLATININISENKATKTCDDMYSIHHRHTSKHLNPILVELISDSIQGRTISKVFLRNKQEFVEFVLQSLFQKPNNERDSSEFALLAPGDRFVLLFNNFGHTSALKINAIANEISSELNRRDIPIEQIYIGTVMSSSHCVFSLTAMKVDDDILKFLNHPTIVSGWPRLITCEDILDTYVDRHFPDPDPSDKELGPILSDKEASQIGKIINTVCLALISCEDQINKISKVQQLGNVGTFVKKSAEKIKQAVDDGDLNLRNPFSMLKQLSVICTNEMSSLATAYYGIVFEGCSQAFIKHFRTTQVSPIMWIDALEKGIHAIEHFAGVQIGEKTLLDALYPMLNVLKLFPENIVDAAVAAEEGSWSTISEDYRFPSVETHIVTIWSRALAEGIKLVQSENNSRKSFSLNLDGDDGDNVNSDSVNVDNDNVNVNNENINSNNVFDIIILD